MQGSEIFGVVFVLALLVGLFVLFFWLGKKMSVRSVNTSLKRFRKSKDKLNDKAVLTYFNRCSYNYVKNTYWTMILFGLYGIALIVGVQTSKELQPACEAAQREMWEEIQRRGLEAQVPGVVVGYQTCRKIFHNALLSSQDKTACLRLPIRHFFFMNTGYKLEIHDFVVKTQVYYVDFFLIKSYNDNALLFKIM